MNPVLVYSRPGCIQCDYTVKELERIGVPYNKFDVTEDQDARRSVEALGFSTLPVVVAGQEKWSGFKVEKLRSLAQT